MMIRVEDMDRMFRKFSIDMNSGSLNAITATSRANTM